jgi:predicted kinase/protein-S-isoprenylcysteine O-methyltransferase Ste14
VKITIPAPALVALVGPTGSGKSTFARKHFRPTEVVSSDHCRGLVSDDESSQAATGDAFDVLYFIARKRLAAGRLTVIDATSVQPEARKRIVALAREYHCSPVAIVLDLPEQVCHERNQGRPGRTFGPEVARQHSALLRRSLPRLEDEGFRRVYVLSSPEEVEAARVERQPFPSSHPHEHGPSDGAGSPAAERLPSAASGSTPVSGAGTMMKNAAKAVATWTAGVAILVGLPLLGWGIADWRGFFAQPARLAYAILAALMSLVTVILAPPSPRKRGDEAKLVRRQGVAVWLLQALSLAIVVAGPYDDRRGLATLSGSAIRAAGLALFVVGQVVMSWALIALGRQFSLEVTIQEDHRLITRGLYRHLRHPRYLGIVLFTLGLALVFRSGVGLALVGGVTLVLLWRIRDEELLLHREFGAEWEAYARRSWRLLPFVH